jgi:hypothetical protein
MSETFIKLIKKIIHDTPTLIGVLWGFLVFMLLAGASSHVTQIKSHNAERYHQELLQYAKDYGNRS